MPSRHILVWLLVRYCCHCSAGVVTDESNQGGITFTGSIVAFLKLAAKMSSRAIKLPGKHFTNIALLGANAATMAGFLSSIPTSTPKIAASFLGVSTLLSFLKGYTTTAAIGGADMRKSTAYISLSSTTHVENIAVVITVLNAYSLASISLTIMDSESLTIF
jgi:NAD/NADP transhydrogenase beta subunit